MYTPTKNGFTLIELLIVIAIMGILAATALNAFESYTIRAKIKEGLDLSAPAKAAISEYYSSKSTFPTSNTLAGIPTATSLSGNYVEQVLITALGAIEITYVNDLRIAGSTIILTPDSSTLSTVKWDCSGGTLVTKYRPSECR